MAKFNLISKEFKDHLVREWTDTSVAPLARWEWTDGNSFDVTIAGTASDGNYVVTITPVAAGVATIPITVVRDTTPATDTDIAAQMVTETNTLLAVAGGDRLALLKTYIQSASNVAGVVSFIAQPDAPAFTVVVSETTATGTIALAPDDVFPITIDTLGYGPQTGARTQLEITVLGISSAGVALDPNGSTTDITVRRMIPRGTISGDGAPSLPCGVANATIESAHPVGVPLRISGGGGRFAFALGAISGTITSLDHLEVWVREVTA